MQNSEFWHLSGYKNVLPRVQNTPSRQIPFVTLDSKITLDSNLRCVLLHNQNKTVGLKKWQIQTEICAFSKNVDDNEYQK